MALSLYDLNNSISTEVSIRTSADTATSVATSTALSTEASIRASTDTVLNGLASGNPTATDVTVTDIADNTRVNLGNNVTNVQVLADTVNTLGVLTMVKSAIDSNLIYTVITYNRPAGGTKFMTSTLSGTSPSYTTRTEVYYDTNGSTVLATKVYTIVYDSNGIVLSETCA